MSGVGLAGSEDGLGGAGNEAGGAPESLPLAGMAVAALGLMGLIVAGGEAAAALKDSSARWSAYAGGAAALIATLSGLPFLIKLTKLGQNDGTFWLYWGLGILTRTGVGLIAALLLLQILPGHEDVLVIVLALVHMTALMIETVWVAMRLSRKTTGK
jgi:hypothetical protein